MRTSRGAFCKQASKQVDRNAHTNMYLSSAALATRIFFFFFFSQDDRPPTPLPDCDRQLHPHYRLLILPFPACSTQFQARYNQTVAILLRNYHPRNINVQTNPTMNRFIKHNLGAVINSPFPYTLIFVETCSYRPDH